MMHQKQVGQAAGAAHAAGQGVVAGGQAPASKRGGVTGGRQKAGGQGNAKPQLHFQAKRATGK